MYSRRGKNAAPTGSVAFALPCQKFLPEGCGEPAFSKKRVPRKPLRLSPLPLPEDFADDFVGCGQVGIGFGDLDDAVHGVGAGQA